MTQKDRPLQSGDGSEVQSVLHPEPWCPDHGYGCEPSNCPCGHTLRCDCRSIANAH